MLKVSASCFENYDDPTGVLRVPTAIDRIYLTSYSRSYAKVYYGDTVSDNFLQLDGSSLTMPKEVKTPPIGKSRTVVWLLAAVLFLPLTGLLTCLGSAREFTHQLQEHI